MCFEDCNNDCMHTPIYNLESTNFRLIIQVILILDSSLCHLHVLGDVRELYLRPIRQVIQKRSLCYSEDDKEKELRTAAGGPFP